MLARYEIFVDGPPRSIIMKLERYRPKPDQQVAAVQLNLETAGFSYQKWGASQFCKRGDWLVESAGDVYSVDADSFARTYHQVGCGAYVKTTPVWAARASQDGEIATREGVTRYRQG